MASMVVMGMGVTGRAVATALLRRNIDVVALDDRMSEELAAWSKETGITVAAPQAVDLSQILETSDGLLPAPGLPHHHPIFAAAATHNVDVLSEFDLAACWDSRPVVAVTGTDGKTTVVTLAHRMLEASGLKAMPVGNTDTPWVEAIEDQSIDIFVVEASSFRLGHSQRFSPQVATWLNFGPDHLDAHDGLEAYEFAKASIWASLESGAVALANRDDDVVSRHAAAIAAFAPGAIVQTFGSDAPPTSVDHGIVDGSLVVGGEELLTVSELSRSLPHDLLNGLAATASTLPVGASRQAAADVLRGFDGLEHRVEHIATIGGVSYVNDSKATTPHAAAAALGGFDSIVLIAGGKNKGLAFDDMLDHVNQRRDVDGRCRESGQLDQCRRRRCTAITGVRVI